MSDHTINLRSESPPLLVEFDLQPGTHARIGSSPEAEIFLPLAGVAEFVCIISRTPEGKIFTSEPDGSNPRFHELPAALPLPPFHFVIFEPTGGHRGGPAAGSRSSLDRPERKNVARLFVPVAMVAAVLIVFAGVIAVNQGLLSDLSQKPRAVEVKPPPLPVVPTENSKISEPVPEPPLPVAEPKPVPEHPALPAPDLDLQSLAERIAPAVFRIEVKDAKGNILGTGTAFSITPDGLAVTNYHVVEKGASFIARTNHGAEFAFSRIIAKDPDADLALISLKATNLPFLELGDSVALKIGAPVAVFGCPQGLSGTLSEGILSARRNEPKIAGYDMPNGGNVIQISAPISAGSSGSPVIDQHGKVIGVAVAAFTAVDAQNLNFVIPVEALIKLCEEFISKGGAETEKNLQNEGQGGGGAPLVDATSQLMDDPDYLLLQKHVDDSDWIQALKIAKPLLERHPDSPLGYRFLALIYHNLGLYAQSDAIAKQGLSVVPDDAILWRLLGIAQIAQKQMAAARGSFQKSIAIEPDTADTWKRLAITYLAEEKYRDAIKPLQTLQKLDAAEFQSLINLCKSRPSKSADLRYMLSQLESSGGTARSTKPGDTSGPQDPAQRALVLVTQFLRHGEEPSILAELSDYADTVDPYFEHGRKTKPEILKDITSYRAQWPLRTLELLSIESAKQVGPNTLEATYRLRFTASNGKRNSSGVILQGIRYTLANGRWLVSGVWTIQRGPQ